MNTSDPRAERIVRVAQLVDRYRNFSDTQLIMHALAQLIAFVPGTQVPELRALWEELLVRTWDEADDEERIP